MGSKHVLCETKSTEEFMRRYWLDKVSSEWLRTNKDAMCAESALTSSRA